jgi:hypothetical protein
VLKVARQFEPELVRGRALLLGQPQRELGQLGRRVGGAAAASASSRVRDLARDYLVTPVAGEGEMPGDLLGVRRHLREVEVGFTTAAQRRRGIHGGRE